MSSNDILNLLLETSRVEFKLSFPVRLIGENEKMKEDLFPMNIFSRLFELAYINKNIRKDGIVQKREYFVVYNTMLGELFVYNLLTQNYDMVDKGLYDLPASAQIFYRRFLHYHNYYSMKLNLTTIIERMNIQNKNMTNVIKGIEQNILNLLKSRRLIVTYKKLTAFDGWPQYKIILPNKGIDKQLPSKKI